MAPEKRGRVVQRACDSCRSGKRKCDGLQVRTLSRWTRTVRSPCVLMIPHFSLPGGQPCAYCINAVRGVQAVLQIR